MQSNIYGVRTKVKYGCSKSESTDTFCNDRFGSSKEIQSICGRKRSESIKTSRATTRKILEREKEVVIIMPSNSEVHAYAHILEELTKKKGWTKKQIYTQQECRKIEAIKEQLGNLTPENVVQLKETSFYVIEAKNERNKLDIAVKEAQDYADKINKSSKIKSHFISGIAGNSEEGFIAHSKFFKDGKWHDIKENETALTGLLSKQQIDIILDSKNPHIKDFEIEDQEFLKSAEKINGILHEGGIHKDYRARVMSALLLAIVEGSEINLDTNPRVLIEAINSRVDVVLKIEAINSRVDVVLNKHKKSDFYRFIKIELPSSEDNHLKFKKAVVLTIQELLALNIRSAMRSGKDILGNFYEVFLKYGNGAKEIGIVLTPRHITRFAAEVLDIQPEDLVLDPTCGTGGFLVAAFDEVRKKATEKELDHFKNWGLYGIEQQDPVVALALVNMIFRGDGKNNIIEGDCFAKWLSATTKNGRPVAEYLGTDKDGRIPPITKVLMNPPFPKKKTDYKEYLFIEQALKQMQDEGILFSILPYSCLVKGGGYIKWRERLLKQHTILSVVTFPEDLFYPVGVHTLGIFIRKGVPHKENQQVLWIRSITDGLLKSKGKRLPNSKAKNDIANVKSVLKEFLADDSTKVPNIREMQKTSPIDLSDPLLELVPEAYLDQAPPKHDQIVQDADSLIREATAFLIKLRKEDQL